jgi:hypothetical protein
VSDKIERIAKEAHEANRRYCIAIGDDSQPAWDDAPEWQRTSCIADVEFVLANPDAPASRNHDCWLAEKERTGWVYGPVKDPEKKQHPCMVPFEELPPHQQFKDTNFKATVLHWNTLLS